jgi:biphenyl-2,3-diol 1,2-dioxygenase
VTGDEGLGHIVLTASDMTKARAFYMDVLGFRLSDIIRMRFGPATTFDMEFLHCNPRHHTLALLPVPAPKRLHHVMLQARTMDDVGFALERAEAAQVPLTATLGRHTNDHMVSFYLRTPSGFEIEYGWGGRTIDDDSAWEVASYASGSIWGHARGQGAGPPGVLRPAPGRD